MARLSVTIFFAIIVVLFSSSTAAPTKDHSMANFESLVHALSQDLSSVPDPGIGDWFNDRANEVLRELAQIFKDPSNVKNFNKLYKPYRDFAEAGIKFLEKYYSDETATMNIVRVLKLFHAAIDKMSNGGGRTNLS